MMRSSGDFAIKNGLPWRWRRWSRPSRFAGKYRVNDTRRWRPIRRRGRDERSRWDEQDKAEKLYLQVLEIRRNILGDFHPGTRSSV